MNFINFRSLDGWSVIVFVLRAINVPPAEIVGGTKSWGKTYVARIVTATFSIISTYITTSF